MLAVMGTDHGIQYQKPPRNLSRDVRRNHGMKEDVYKFWEEQSKKGIKSGTKDLILDELERKAISSFLTNGLHVLEVGCGDGRNSIEMRQHFDVHVDAFDYSPGMVSAATENARQALISDINFFVHDLNEVDSLEKKYDLVVSKRALINLSDYNTQVEVIKRISKVLKPGGLFLMCESSKRGLDTINTARVSLELDQITPPWHNVYIDDDKLASEALPLELAQRLDFSSTYYFLSRVVNAKMAKMNGSLPDYDSPINKWALQLPVFGQMGQTILWIWRNPH
ncbi:MAG: class I SAM-dependent methyltransferase [Leptospirales bacterium]|nr:class I SAM-dependent methyltransferase [Leptospirales bacterium]HNJ35760.1 class I SAM-dependent methyltransferase [Leptospiraceae bacterium]HNL70220.1 class I SAM-dependent methyltransferase [Leptospiraceae bacterium]